jgi:hypothetical protein
VGWGVQLLPLKYAYMEQNDKNYYETTFGDKETTMYVHSIVYIRNYAINVVFVYLFPKTPPSSEIISWIPFHQKSGLLGGTLSILMR